MTGHLRWAITACAMTTWCAAAVAGVSELWGRTGELWRADGRLPDFSHAGYHCGDDPIPKPSVATSVRLFGAKGDGVTDDTKAFQRAIDATAEGAIRVPRGRYVITDFVYIRRPKIVLLANHPISASFISPPR